MFFKGLHHFFNFVLQNILSFYICFGECICKLRMRYVNYFSPKVNHQSSLTEDKEAVIRGVLLKKVFFKISEISHENTCAWISY